MIQLYFNVLDKTFLTSTSRYIYWEKDIHFHETCENHEHHIHNGTRNTRFLIQVKSIAGESDIKSN